MNVIFKCILTDKFDLFIQFSQFNNLHVIPAQCSVMNKF